MAWLHNFFKQTVFSFGLMVLLIGSCETGFASKDCNDEIRSRISEVLDLEFSRWETFWRTYECYGSFVKASPTELDLELWDAYLKAGENEMGKFVVREQHNGPVLYASKIIGGLSKNKIEKSDWEPALQELVELLQCGEIRLSEYSTIEFVHTHPSGFSTPVQLSDADVSWAYFVASELETTPFQGMFFMSSVVRTRTVGNFFRNGYHKNTFGILIPLQRDLNN